jgi:hypothetical protein
MLKIGLKLAAGAWGALHLQSSIFTLRLRLIILRLRIRRLRSFPQIAFEEIDSICKESSQRQLEVILKKTSIDALTEYGGNVTILRRNGFERLSDLTGETTEKLQRIPGIGPMKSQQTITAYMQAVRKISKKIEILPSRNSSVVMDYGPLIAIVKYFRLLDECNAQADTLDEQEKRLCLQLMGFGLPTLEFIQNEGIRTPWHDYMTKLHATHQQLVFETEKQYRKFAEIKVSEAEAWQRYTTDSPRFMTLARGLNIHLEA